MWSHLAQEKCQVSGSCEHVNEFSGSIKDRKFTTSWVTISFSRKTDVHFTS